MRVPTFRAVAKPETLLGLPPAFFYSAAAIGIAVTVISGGKVFLGIVTAMSTAVFLYALSRKTPFIVHNISCRAKYKKPKTAAPPRFSRFIPAMLFVLLLAENAHSSAIHPQAPALIDYFHATGAVLAAFGFAGLAGVLCAPYLKRFLRLPPVDTMRVRVPFDKAEVDTGIIHLSNGATCLVISVPGVSDSLQDPETAGELFRFRQRCILSLVGKPLIARFVTLRHRQEVHTPCLHANTILNRIHQAWESAFAGTVFRNDHYIILSTRTAKRGERRSLVEAGTEFCDFLEAYNAEILRPNAGGHDHLFSFLFQFTNCYFRSVPTPPDVDGVIPDLTGTIDFPGVLSSSTVDFDQDSTLIHVHDGSFSA
ncbi:MAG: hypothetical protein MI741_15510, partial [Rhodospirillales bacterium]|nr:hypothetical protein [Rhodospirillales bacterium]